MINIKKGLEIKAKGQEYPQQDTVFIKFKIMQSNIICCLGIKSYAVKRCTVKKTLLSGRHMQLSTASTHKTLTGLEGLI